MPRRSKVPGSPNPADGLGFLLSQVGSHSSSRFAELLEPLGFKPHHVGILNVLRQSDGLSQQALGEKLGVFASRLVGIIDEMEAKGLIERRNNQADRRSYAVHLKPAGLEALERIGAVTRDLREALFASLSEAERGQLAEFLRRIADEQGLTPGVHPGYRKLGGGDAK